MKFLETELPGVIVVEPDVHRDGRGFFLETYHEKKYREGGIPLGFVQDNCSKSSRGTLRGLHSQRTKPQGKLVAALRGEIFDVAVDVRRGSPTFGKWTGVVLSDENFRQLYVPPDFLHGFAVLSETAQVLYKCTEFYDPRDEYGVIWNDSALAIDWPLSEPVLSKRDAALHALKDIEETLPAYNG